MSSQPPEQPPPAAGAAGPPAPETPGATPGAAAEPDPAAPSWPFPAPPGGPESPPGSPAPLPDGQPPLREEPRPATPPVAGSPILGTTIGRGGSNEPGPPWGGVLGALGWVLIGLFAWAAATFVVGSVVLIAASLAGAAPLTAERLPPGVLIAATVAGDVVFLAVPVGLAAITARPRLSHFGLRRTRFWPAVGWVVAGLTFYLLFSVIYSALVHPTGQQTTADDLGVNRSVALMVIGGFVVIVLAPIFEEFFFRAFVYRTLRNGLVPKMGVRSGVALAAILDGLVFGVVHATNTPLGILPVLAVLAVVFCLVYERTGSLFAVIAMHALVNTFGYLAVAKNSVWVALGFGLAMLVACAVVPRMIGPGRPRAEAFASA